MIRLLLTIMCFNKIKVNIQFIINRPRTCVLTCVDTTW